MVEADVVWPWVENDTVSVAADGFAATAPEAKPTRPTIEAIAAAAAARRCCICCSLRLCPGRPGQCGDRGFQNVRRTPRASLRMMDNRSIVRRSVFLVPRSSDESQPHRALL